MQTYRQLIMAATEIEREVQILRFFESLLTKNIVPGLKSAEKSSSSFQTVIKPLPHDLLLPIADKHKLDFNLYGIEGKYYSRQEAVDLVEKYSGIIEVRFEEAK